MKQLISMLVIGSISLALAGCKGEVAQPSGRLVAGPVPKAAPGADEMRQALTGPIEGKKK